ncbi:GTP-binding protein [Sporomusa sp.]|uniref:GTP-binding protein n=1 Tax=Sporomusa sp. TaxID=2078658 RepID=UPI002C2F8155|nr:GTP-binding protein [Sporomusa sp.]HWR45738.1 GTP-binding protein [Sporomusa sp.]
MRILLFGGFLGSGKTTTILQVAKYLTTTRQETVAIVENEIGAAGVDDKLFSDSGLQVKRLFGGCVCCQITSDLISAMDEIHATIKPDWLMIEMTGLAYPSKTAKMIKKYSRVYSAFKTVTIVDRGRWSELVAMLKPLVIGQVEGSDLIVLNKADLAGDDTQKIERDLREIDANLKVVITSAAKELPVTILEEVVCCE